MSHEVENMMSDRMPWHGLGVVVDGAQTALDALVLSGLDYEVELQRVFYERTVTASFAQTGEVEVPQRFEVENRRAVVRNTDGAFYGLVSDRYPTFQNRQAFALADDVVGAPGGPNFKTAGALYGGRQVFMTLKFPEDVLIGGVSPVELYLVLLTSHDGSLALTLINTPVVAVCKNTCSLALRQATAKWTVKHTGDMEGKVEEARRALDLSFNYHAEWTDEMNKLAETTFTKGEFEKLVKDLYPSKKSGFSPQQYGLIGVLDASPNIQDDLRLTKWGALMAITEHSEWSRDTRAGSDGSARLERSLITDMPARTRAFDCLVSV